MPTPPAPKFIVIDQFLPDELIDGLDKHVEDVPNALELMDFGGLPQEGHYSAQRKLWVHREGLGKYEARFRAAVDDHLEALFEGTGVPPFDVARMETELCVQRPGSFFAKHIDTDTREPRQSLASDRLISSVFYFPREPLAFAGGELTLFDFTGRSPIARIEVKRNRLVAFPSFACHEVTPVTGSSNSIEAARRSINCWLHRSRKPDPR